jgi:CheY-like chemotaxis protein
MLCGRGAAMARILLVEDDPEVRPLLEHIIMEKGHKVTATESVAIATSLLNSQPFDLPAQSLTSYLGSAQAGLRSALSDVDRRRAAAAGRVRGTERG